MTGTLFGLGLGPGDPDLVTLRAARILSRVPVVAYPRAEGQESFARRIAAPHLSGFAREIAMPLPMVAGTTAPAAPAYDRGADAIAAELAAGNDVAVLCEGDPLFFGSFARVLARLGRRFPVVVVPGVSSVMAAAALAGAPLAMRDDSFAAIPAPLPDNEIERRLSACDGFAILKLGRHFGRVRALLGRLGLADGCSFVSHATLPEARVLPLAQAESDAPYFSLILGHRRERGGIAA